MRRPALLLALAVPLVGVAQPAPAPLPDKHVPPTVLMELRALENQFDLALVRDCAPERCVSKGCVYRDHVVVDLPRSSSLPGLGQTEGIGSVPPQEYLTQAHCEFAHEKSVAPRDVQALTKRLEQRLSKGWLVVSVGRQLLEPISPSLSESPPPPTPPAPKPAETVAPPPPPPPQWEWNVAVRELWLSLLPHFSWMIAVVLGTLATLAIIWASRRLGRESLEEKAMAAQLLASAGVTPVEKADEPKPESEQATQAAEAPAPVAEESAALIEQRRKWTDRVARAELGKESDGVVELLREWLREGELALLAKAILVFGDRLPSAFPSDGELAGKKVDLAEFLRNVDEARLPSDAEFFKTLDQHAIAASLLAQTDAETLRSLREELGSAGLAQLMGRLPLRHGALLFALVPSDLQDEVARTLSAELRWGVAKQLLVTNRMSREEQQYLFAALDAVRSGHEVPPEPAPASDGLLDRGRALDAAGALSVLLPLIEPADRQPLLAEAFRRASGVHPRWYEDILYPEMVLRLPPERQADLLLEVDVRGLAGWTSLQDAGWQQQFMGLLPHTLQNAVRANMGFTSRKEQQRLARQGREELASAVKRLLAQGQVSFAELLG